MEDFVNGSNMKNIMEKIGPYTPRIGKLEPVHNHILSAEQVRERILYSIRGIENDTSGYKREHERILEAIKLVNKF